MLQDVNERLNGSSSTASISSPSTTQKRASPRLAMKQTKKVKTYEVT